VQFLPIIPVFASNRFLYVDLDTSVNANIRRLFILHVASKVSWTTFAVMVIC
jgi:hypothetical protein